MFQSLQPAKNNSPQNTSKTDKKEPDIAFYRDMLESSRHVVAMNSQPAQMMVEVVPTNAKNSVGNKGMFVNDSPALENEADVMGKKAAQGKNADVIGIGSGVQKQDAEESELKKHSIVWGDTLSEIAQQYNVSLESLAEWNNIQDVNKIYAGDEIYVEDPQKHIDLENFETYPQVKESSGWLMGEKGIQGTNASTMVELVAASIQNFDVVNLTGGLLLKIQNDPDMVATQQEIIEKIKTNPRYGKEDFYITGKELVEFGGSRWSASDENWGSLGNKNPAMHGETWDVAKNELTWALRHATVKYWAQVSPSGSITIQYRLNDRLDLSSSPGRSGAYNIISDVLGFGYHTIAGGNINLQTRAEWSVSF